MLNFGRGDVARRKHDVLIALGKNHQNLFTVERQIFQNLQHILSARPTQSQLIQYDQLLVGYLVGQCRFDRQATHLLGHIMMIWMRSWTPDHAAMTELGSTRAPLARATG